MSESQDKRSYVDIDALIVRTGLSRATIWRLKRDGKIPFFQPGGKGSRVKFPVDAIEWVEQYVTSRSVADDMERASCERLPGPRPEWMSTRKYNQKQ